MTTGIARKDREAGVLTGAAAQGRHRWRHQLAWSVAVAMLLVAIAGMPSQAANKGWASSRKHRSVTAYTKGTYYGFSTMPGRGTVSKSNMYGKMSKTTRRYPGGYAVHDHWQRRVVCRVSGFTVSLTGLGLSWNCSTTRWVRFKNDYRSRTFTNKRWWKYLGNSWAKPHFQAERVALSAATCVVVRWAPDSCSGGTWAGR